MTYVEAVKQSMNNISKIQNAIFIGYNLKYASKSYGTLADVNPEKIIEMPVAEQVMTGLATGLSMGGYLPILCFERHDFLLLAMDQIVNHLCKMRDMTKDHFKPKVIIRAIVGGTKPFHPGPQHTQDFTSIIRDHTNMLVIEPLYPEDVLSAYETAVSDTRSVFISEKRDLYNND